MKIIKILNADLYLKNIKNELPGPQATVANSASQKCSVMTLFKNASSIFANLVAYSDLGILLFR
jgi:hypothetical protein